MRSFPLIVLLLITFCFSARAQQYKPQFRFHFAFEDATGQRDTIWFVLDSLGRWNYIDTILGEEEIVLSPTKFETYIRFFVNPSTGGIGKTLAGKALMGSIDIGDFIYAQNETLPIKMSWDTSLFRNNGLGVPIIRATMESDYFFFVNNCAACHHMFNMMWQDTVTLHPYSSGSGTHFPIYAYLSDYPLGLGNDVATSWNDVRAIIYPNPADRSICVRGYDETEVEIWIVDIFGKRHQTGLRGTNCQATSDLPSGLYIVNIGEPVSGVVISKIVSIMH